MFCIYFAAGIASGFGFCQTARVHCSHISFAALFLFIWLGAWMFGSSVIRCVVADFYCVPSPAWRSLSIQESHLRWAVVISSLRSVSWPEELVAGHLDHRSRSHAKHSNAFGRTPSSWKAHRRHNAYHAHQNSNITNQNAYTTTQHTHTQNTYHHAYRLCWDAYKRLHKSRKGQTRS